MRLFNQILTAAILAAYTISFTVAVPQENLDESWPIAIKLPNSKIVYLPPRDQKSHLPSEKSPKPLDDRTARSTTIENDGDHKNNSIDFSSPMARNFWNPVDAIEKIALELSKFNHINDTKIRPDNNQKSDPESGTLSEDNSVSANVKEIQNRNSSSELVAKNFNGDATNSERSGEHSANKVKITGFSERLSVLPQEEDTLERQGISEVDKENVAGLSQYKDLDVVNTTRNDQNNNLVKDGNENKYFASAPNVTDVETIVRKILLNNLLPNGPPLSSFLESSYDQSQNVPVEKKYPFNPRYKDFQEASVQEQGVNLNYESKDSPLQSFGAMNSNYQNTQATPEQFDESNPSFYDSMDSSVQDPDKYSSMNYGSEGTPLPIQESVEHNYHRSPSTFIQLTDKFNPSFQGLQDIPVQSSNGNHQQYPGVLRDNNDRSQDVNLNYDLSNTQYSIYPYESQSPKKNDANLPNVDYLEDGTESRLTDLSYGKNGQIEGDSLDADAHTRHRKSSFSDFDNQALSLIDNMSSKDNQANMNSLRNLLRDGKYDNSEERFNETMSKNSYEQSFNLNTNYDEPNAMISPMSSYKDANDPITSSVNSSLMNFVDNSRFQQMRLPSAPLPPCSPCPFNPYCPSMKNYQPRPIQNPLCSRSLTPNMMSCLPPSANGLLFQPCQSLCCHYARTTNPDASPYFCLPFVTEGDPSLSYTSCQSAHLSPVACL